MKIIMGFGGFTELEQDADDCIKKLHMIDKILDVTPEAKLEMEKHIEERNAYWHEKFSAMNNDEWSSFLMAELIGSLDKRCKAKNKD